MPNRNKDLVRRLFEDVFNGKDLAACRDIIAVDYVETAIAPFGQDAPGAVIGPEHMRNVVQSLADQFPDLNMTIESLIADGDTVAARVTSEGTNLGNLNGVVPPTGRRFLAGQSHWYRVVDGKLAEHWATRDDLSAMLQLGIVQRPAHPRSSRRSVETKSTISADQVDR